VFQRGFCGFFFSLSGNILKDVTIGSPLIRCDRSVLHLFIFGISGPSMLSGSPVTTAWRVLRLRMEETASRYGG
jgi:hypothetical protein